MRSFQKTIRLFLTTVFLLSLSFLEAQKTDYSKDFLTIKKSIDTLSILPAIVEVRAITLGGKVVGDSAVYEIIRDKIAKKSNEILQDKYNIKNTDFTDSILTNEVYTLIYQLEVLKKDIELIKFSDSTLSLLKDTCSRYCLINVYNKIYKTQERVKEEEKQLCKLSISVGLLSLGTVTIFPDNLYYNSTLTLLFDKQTGRVIYYKKTANSSIEQLIYQNLKTLYYK